ncbi:hypothetical protein N7541_002621 [Penicillium brevicompactum]|uniref:Velvet complex subunit laeA n=1 Tax=Penicillium brevicompactum TaxID=5074 RepID=A0A9W9RK73_PENBR|nr:hypothetical protein N7541_002621 [Penicillium brevicompactum]
MSRDYPIIDLDKTMSRRDFSGSFPAPDRISLPRMYTNGDRDSRDNHLRHLPPMPSPPPAKRYKSESNPPSEVGSRYYSHSVGASDRGRSRQPSNAMDLCTLIDRDPVDTDPRRNARFMSNGSVATQASMVSNASHLSRSSPIISNDKKIPEKYPLTKKTAENTMDTERASTRSPRAGDGLLYAPMPKNARILDLGCGTGIWGIEMAKKFPDAFVVGCDLAPIQPSNSPKNCDFYAPFDFESPWTLGDDSWDIVHMQMAAGSVASWPSLYRRIHQHLRPGGWVEQLEIDFEPRCQGSSPGPALTSWYSTLRHATESSQRPIAHSPSETIRALRDAGFTEIDHQTVGLPLNPWHTDEHEQKVARWYNLAISESVFPLSLAPFSRVLGWTKAQIEQISADVKHEAFDKQKHTWNMAHIYQARKPLVPVVLD